MMRRQGWNMFHAATVATAFFAMATLAACGGEQIGEDDDQVRYTLQAGTRCTTDKDCGSGPDVACFDHRCYTRKAPSGPVAPPPRCATREDCGEPGNPDIACQDGLCIKRGPAPGTPSSPPKCTTDNDCGSGPGVRCEKGFCVK